MKLSELNRYINSSFGDEYFELSVTWEILNCNDSVEGFKCVLYGKMMFKPDDSSVIRIKKYYKEDYSSHIRDEFTDEFIQWVFRCIIMSRESKNLKYQNQIIRPFADYKKIILDSKNKNNANLHINDTN
jgi:hypothetical protein